MKGFLSFIRVGLQSSLKQYFDFGSTTTRVLIGDRLVYCEPSCMALHRESKSVVALGSKAYNLLGKTTSAVTIVFPIFRGNWTSFELAQLYCKAVERAVGERWSLQSYFFGPAGLFAQSPVTTPLEAKVNTQVLRSSGLQRVQCIARPKAVFQHRRTSKAETEVLAIIDLGGQVVEASVVVGGECLRSHSFSWGGVQLTEQVQAFVRATHGCLLGWRVAEEVKYQLLRFYSGLSKSQTTSWKETKLAVRGKDVITQTVKTVIVSSGEFEVIAQQAYEELEENLRDFLAKVPSELGATVLHRGVVLSGGSSQLRGLKEALEKAFQCEFLIGERPELDAVEGLAKLL